MRTHLGNCACAFFLFVRGGYERDVNVMVAGLVGNICSTIDVLAAFLSRDQHKGLQRNQFSFADFFQRRAIDRRFPSF